MTKGKYAKLAVSVLVIAGLAVLGLQRWQYARQYIRTDNAEVEGVIIRIRARLIGVVVQVQVHENTRVNQGDLLFQVREDEYQQRVELEDARRQADFMAKALSALLTARIQG